MGGLKKVFFYFFMIIAFILFISFFIWASVEGKQWIIFAFFALIVVAFLFLGFMWTALDKRKKLKELQKQPDYIDEVLGGFKSNGYGYFISKITWSQNSVELRLQDPDDRGFKDCVDYARVLFENQNEWDKRICNFVTEDLINLANDWNDDGISQEEFRNRIRLMSIMVTCSGRFEFWFDSDGIFSDHTIVVYGDVKNGAEYSDIVG